MTTSINTSTYRIDMQCEKVYEYCSKRRAYLYAGNFNDLGINPDDSEDQVLAMLSLGEEE